MVALLAEHLQSMDTDLKFVMFKDEEEDESTEAEGNETRKSMGTDDEVYKYMNTLLLLYFYIDLTVNVLIVRMATISIHFVHPAIHFQRSRPFFSRFIFENCKARNLA